MEIKFEINNKLDLAMQKEFFGPNDLYLNLLAKKYQLQFTFNNNILNIEGENVDCFEIVISILKEIENKVLAKEELSEIIVLDLINEKESKEKFDKSIVFTKTYQGKIIRPKNLSQANYFNLLANNTITFALGAAGTGKTYLAVAYAINLLKAKKINKIIITRPIVEAGENLGFLPGEVKEKVDPYLIPIYDSLYDILGKENTDKYLEKGVIEIAPLAYMRGRTLSDAYVILDEAQNTTNLQMKMFLTRLGYQSKMVITGDESQIDLKNKKDSGIINATNILKDIEDIAIIHFASKDVVRHPLVSKIINAYEKKEEEYEKNI